jgi:hypothetical protein
MGIVAMMDALDIDRLIVCEREFRKSQAQEETTQLKPIAANLLNCL